MNNEIKNNLGIYSDYELWKHCCSTYPIIPPLTDTVVTDLEEIKDINLFCSYPVVSYNGINLNATSFLAYSLDEVKATLKNISILYEVLYKGKTIVHDSELNFISSYRDTYVVRGILNSVFEVAKWCVELNKTLQNKINDISYYNKIRKYLISVSKSIKIDLSITDDFRPVKCIEVIHNDEPIFCYVDAESIEDDFVISKKDVLKDLQHILSKFTYDDLIKIIQ